MRIELTAGCLAAGLVLIGASTASAGERPTNKSTARANASYATTTASSQPASGSFERKCVIMSCGTPWCYDTRVK